MTDFEAQVVFGQQVEVRVQGDLDVATAPQLTEAVAYAVGGGHPDLVIDVRAVTFCDSSGLAALLDATKRAGTVTLRAPSSAMQRSLEVTGLDQVFAVIATPD